MAVLDDVQHRLIHQHRPMILARDRQLRQATLGGTLEVPVHRLMVKRALITGSTLRPRSADEKARLAAEVERVVWPWVAAGKVRAIVDRTYPLAEAAAAHAYLESGDHVGKIVLVP